MADMNSLNEKVALITGAAGGIGKAIARRLLLDGARVALTDIDGDALRQFGDECRAEFGHDRVFDAVMNVTSESDVEAGLESSRLHFGQLDIVISNAGLAIAAPIIDTTLADWDKTMDILGKGYFLVTREAMRLFKRQGTGGNIIHIGSKNGMTASINAAAYCAAKASEVNLARCAALEGGEFGVRVNTVSTEAVIRGSAIWTSAWREERARAYGVAPDQLEEYYKNRTILKESIFPEDVADAVAFFASDRSKKMTGNVLNVDGGNVLAFSR